MSGVARQVIQPFRGTVRISLVIFLVLASASWTFILADANSGFPDLFTSQTWSSAANFIGKLAGVGEAGTPAFLQAGRWAETGILASNTLAMSILAIVFAGTGALLTFLPAARNVAMGELSPSRRATPGWVLFHYVVRVTFMLTRGIPELVWAMLIIIFLSPGILPGAVALGLHNYGILGKLSAEVVEDMDPRPARALRASGAGAFQMMAYGIIPQVLPQFITYLLYRWEVVIRTTIVVGFVSAGGLGMDFRLSMSFFHYSDIALLLAWYLLLVVGIDLLCAGLRKLIAK